MKIVAYKWNIIKANGVFMASARAEGGVRKLLHRWIVDAKDDEVVTPKDGNYLNVQKSNLEIRRKAAVAFTSTKGRVNTTGYRGVVERNGKFIAQISGCYLGTFATAEQAAKAYDDKAFEAYGVRINFPNHIDTSPTTHIQPT